MSVSTKTYLLLVTSEAWRERLPERRLKATLAEAILRGAGFAVATSEGCDPDRETIEADLWSASGWARGRCDRPDVVAVWGGGPLLKRQQAAHDWVTRRFPVIRAVGPNKASLREFLANSPVERYLPPQELLPAADAEAALLAAMRRHGALVVKPAAGSSGKGVRFLVPEGEAWRLQAGEASVEGTAEDLVAGLVGEIGGRLGYRQFVAQKYVRSVAPDGRALQFRIDLHKDGAGAWRIIQTSAHFGRPGLLVSNIARGGAIGHLRGAAGMRVARPADDIHDEAIELAHSAARALDAHPKASVHEVGVDIAIDEDDRLWLLEVNLYPETTLHEMERAELAVDFGLAVAEGRLPPSRRFGSD